MISRDEHIAAVAAAQQEGATEARTRIRAILTCEAAKGREPMARSLALETSMPAEDAERVLAAMPCTAGVAQ
ncbi:hypothetical protein PZ895_11385 [Mesorhizobium sp. YIM 152430]|uniref:hypothetical protein n=1 Tax=Mesorhizobium sp. YIM 152430 TaxID=3031761 RepID=UPI0023D99804|nr:hypothetical protein [Mesorhizobium sp. YIM 152430]MDF1600362.1 hypothetical protein [Mesorhizobium sp. YIM 152430]